MKKNILFLFTVILFNVNAQTISDVSPSFGDDGDIIPVTITGVNTSFTSSNGTFVFHQGSNTLDFPSSPTIVNNTSATGDIDLSNFSTGSANVNGGFFDLRYSFLQGSAYTNAEMINAFFINMPLNGSFAISGTITTGTPKTLGSGDPVIFSKLFLQNKTTGKILLNKRTDASGVFTFDDLTEGDYYLHIYNTTNDSPLLISVGENKETTNLNLQFKNDHIVSGINDDIFNTKYQFNIKPTFFNDKINVVMNLSKVSNIQFEVTNTNGQLVFNLEKENQIGQVNVDLADQFRNIPKGFYFITTTVGNNLKTVKVLKK